MQYSFIYQALLEYYLYGDTELDVASLEKHLQTLYSPAPHFEKVGLEREFKVSRPAWGGLLILAMRGKIVATIG